MLRPQLLTKYLYIFLSIYNFSLSSFRDFSTVERQPSDDMFLMTDLTYIKLVSDPHELFGGVDLVGVYFFDGLLSVVHQLEKLVGPCQVIKWDVILFNCYRGVCLQWILY